MWRDQCVVSGEPAVPVILAGRRGHGAVLNAAAEVVFLGLDDHGGIFAADLSPARGIPGGRGGRRGAGPGRAGPGRHPLARRGRAAGLRAGDPVLASPSALLRHLRIPDPERPRRAPQDVPERGVRAAAFPAGRARGDHARREPGHTLCLLARHKGSAAGSYSTLAGFVGVCESLEDAVRREVAEETGVPVGTVTYHGLPGLALPVRADDRLPGRRVGGERAASMARK